MNHSSGHFFDLDLLTPALGLTFKKKTIATVHRLLRDGVIAVEEYRTQTGPVFGRGQPRKQYFLSLSGALALASHARTPEATVWRREQLAGCLTLPSLSLPAAPTADVTVLQQAVFELTQRVDALTTTQSAVVERVEKIEARIPEQLMLPGVVRSEELGSPLVALVIKLLEQHGGPRTTKELISFGGDELIDLTGGKTSTKSVTVAIQKAAKRNDRLRLGENGDHFFTWSLRRSSGFVVPTANGVH